MTGISDLEQDGRVRGMAHGLSESRPLADWVSDLRWVVKAKPDAEVVLPDGSTLSAAEWLAAWDAEQARSTP